MPWEDTRFFRGGRLTTVGAGHSCRLHTRTAVARSENTIRSKFFCEAQYWTESPRTIKMTDESKQLCTALLLLLSTTAAVKSSSGGGESSGLPIAEYEMTSTSDREFTTAYDPNVSFDRNIVVATQLYASSQEIKNGDPVGSLIKVIEPESTIKRDRDNCFIPFRQATSTYPIRRLSYKTALLVAHADEDGQKRTNLVLVNTNNCNYALAYNGSLPEKVWIFPSNDDNSSHGSFALIAHDAKICRNRFGWCRLFFDPFYRRIEPVNFDFSPDALRDVEPVGSANGNLFAVRLLDAAIVANKMSTLYRTRLYSVTDDAPGNHKELFNWTKSTMRYELSSSLSSLIRCRKTTRDWTHGNDTYRCVKYRRNGSVLLDRSVVYPRQIPLTRALPIPNGLILSNDRCTDNVCTKKVVAITMGRNGAIKRKYLDYEFACPSLDSSMQYYRWNVTDGGSIDVDHVCVGTARVTLHKLLDVSTAFGRFQRSFDVKAL